MTKIAAIALTALIASAGAASAQTFYFGVGPDPYYAPRPYYGPSPYGPTPNRPRYSSEAMFYRPGRYRTWNGCQPGWTVQSGLCKPYRGY